MINGESTRFNPRLLELFLELNCFAHFYAMTVPTVPNGLFGLQLLAICFALYFFSCSSQTFLVPNSNNHFSSARHLRLSAILFNTLHHAQSAASIPLRKIDMVSLMSLSADLTIVLHTLRKYSSRSKSRLFYSFVSTYLKPLCIPYFRRHK